MAALGNAQTYPRLARPFANGLGNAGQSRWRCNQAGQHECSLALGLATDPTTCCSKPSVCAAVNDAPHLLQIKDVAAEGEAQIEAYACAERPGVRRKGVKCGPMSSLGVSRPIR